MTSDVRKDLLNLFLKIQIQLFFCNICNHKLQLSWLRSSKSTPQCSAMTGISWSSERRQISILYLIWIGETRKPRTVTQQLKKKSMLRREKFFLNRITLNDSIFSLHYPSNPRWRRSICYNNRQSSAEVYASEMLSPSHVMLTLSWDRIRLISLLSSTIVSRLHPIYNNFPLFFHPIHHPLNFSLIFIFPGNYFFMYWVFLPGRGSCLLPSAVSSLPLLVVTYVAALEFILSPRLEQRWQFHDKNDDLQIVWSECASATIIV